MGGLFPRADSPDRYRVWAGALVVRDEEGYRLARHCNFMGEHRRARMQVPEPKSVTPSTPGEPYGSTAFAISGLLAGILGIVFLASMFLLPLLTTAPQALSSYNTHQSAYLFFGAASGLFAVGAVPFIAGLGSSLRARGRELSSSATLLSVLGVFSIALAALLYVASLATISSTAAPTPADANYQAALWFTIPIALLVLGTAAWGTGFFLFGLLTWKSGVLPNWLAVIGIVGGVAGWTIVSQPVAFLVSIVSIALPVAFVIWGLGSGALILSGRVRPAPS